jgi:hypothetical protein
MVDRMLLFLLGVFFVVFGIGRISSWENDWLEGVASVISWMVAGYCLAAVVKNK